MRYSLSTKKANRNTLLCIVADYNHVADPEQIFYWMFQCRSTTDCKNMVSKCSNYLQVNKGLFCHLRI